MDRADIERTLGWMNPAALRRVQGRRVKVYSAFLDKNFYLKNPSGRRLSNAVLFRLAQGGVTSGWKKGAGIWLHDVNFLEIGLMKFAQSQPQSEPDVCL
jgi:hypothetical protein